MLTKSRAFDLHEYEIMIEVGAGVSLPEKKKYHIKV